MRAPMYNFGMPPSFKARLDYVLQAGVKFRYSEGGPDCLLKGKRAKAILSRSALYNEGPKQAMASQEPHLHDLLRFIGITGVPFLRAETLSFGTEACEQALEAVRERSAKPLDEAWHKAA